MAYTKEQLDTEKLNSDLQATALNHRVELLMGRVMDAIRPLNGGLVVLAASVQRLSAASYLLELIQKKMTVEGLHFTEVVNDALQGEVLGSLVVFGELREQHEPQHSAELAVRYLEAGATVLSVIHGLHLDGVKRRLIQLGMPHEMAEEVTVVDYLDLVLTDEDFKHSVR